MTERRDLAASSESAPPRRVLGGEFLRRRLMAATVAGLVLVILGWTAWGLMGRAARWLHGQPEYTVAFETVELTPPPPDAVRDGREGILARVRAKSKIDGPIHLLDQDLQELGLAFAKHSPWVAKVERVERAFPRRIVVHVVYREPVARIDLDGGKSRFLVIASDGVVIAGEDVKPERIATLPRLEGFTSTPEALPGRYLGADQDGVVPEQITSAVRLASYLRENRPQGTDRLRIAAVNLSKAPRSLWLRTTGGLWICWHSSPGDERDDEPRAKEKLERLNRWEDTNEGKPIPDRQLLDLSEELPTLRPRPDHEG